MNVNFPKGRSGLLLLLMLVSVMTYSCKKQEKAEVPPTVENLKLEKVARFTAITVGVPKEKLQFNAETKEFFVTGTNMKLSYEKMERIYDGANVYKLNYE